MRSLPALLLALILVTAVALSSCGGVTAFGFRSDLPAVSGTVSSVGLSVIDGNVQVTVVTLQANGMSNQFAFCGDNRHRFPMNTSVTVQFNPGQNCNVIAVVITG